MAEPRVNAAMLASLEGRGVTLLGLVAESSAGGAALVVTAADKKPVSVTVAPAGVVDAQVAAGHWVDITGTVQHGKVVATQIYHLPSPIDLDLYNQALVFSQTFPNIF